jgi:hypothetical protein
MTSRRQTGVNTLIPDTLHLLGPEPHAACPGPGLPAAAVITSRRHLPPRPSGYAGHRLHAARLWPEAASERPASRGHGYATAARKPSGSARLKVSELTFSLRNKVLRLRPRKHGGSIVSSTRPSAEPFTTNRPARAVHAARSPEPGAGPGGGTDRTLSRRLATAKRPRWTERKRTMRGLRRSYPRALPPAPGWRSSDPACMTASSIIREPGRPRTRALRTPPQLRHLVPMPRTHHVEGDNYR